MLFRSIIDDIRGVGMEAIVEPEWDHWELQQVRNRARACVDQNHFQEAHDLLTPIIDHQPPDGHAHYLLAYTMHLLRNDCQKALRHYDIALQAGFDEFWVRYNQGALCLDLGMLAQAKDHLTRAHALRPDHPGVLALLGNA